MPPSPDPAKKDRRSRRHGRAVGDDLNQRERELRRARGEIACAECTRLKSRCDRKVPCSSCTRRGRPSICPNGISGSSQDYSLLYDTAQLRQKLSEMSDRIRQLEDALEILQQAHSSLPHPLLHKDLLEIKRGSSVAGASPASAPDDLDALGTLTISENGASRFHGRGGGAESLFLTGNDDPPENEASTPPLLPLPISQIANAWPFTSVDIPCHNLLVIVESYLPPWERASGLCETYLGHMSWLIRPVLRDQLFDELLPIIYKRKTTRASALERDAHSTATLPSNPDDLALLLMVFAVGALVDLTQAPYNKEAETYHQLARATMSFAKVFESPSLAALQALGLMGAYGAFSGRNSTLDPSWSMISLACTLARTMGLHRDPASWKLDPKMVDRRRNVFWELFLMESLHCLMCGRPSSFVLKYGDCQFPQDTDLRIDANGGVEPSYWNWKLRYSKDVVHQLNDVLSEVAPTKYSDILRLDRIAREVLVPPAYLQMPPEGPNWVNDGPALFMARLATSIVRDIMMMHIHRSFFAKALLDHPADPLSSQYAHSFLSAYNSSLSIIKAIRVHHELCPDLLSRLWIMWSHAFSATIIIGSVVIRGPSSDLAPTSLIELSLGIELFEKAQLQHDRAKRALPILLRLQDKAYRAYSQFRHGQPSSVTRGLGQGGNWEGELEIFSGKTTLVETKDSFRPPTRCPSAPGVLSPGSNPDQSQANATLQTAQRALQASSMDTFPDSSDRNNLLTTHASSDVNAGLLSAMAYPEDPASTAYARTWIDSLGPLFPNSLSAATQLVMSEPPLVTPDPSFEAVYPGSYGTVTASHSPPHSAMFTAGPSDADPSGSAYNQPMPSEYSGMDEAWRSLMQESDLLMTL